MFVSFKRKTGKTAVSIKTILEFYSIQLKFYNGCFILILVSKSEPFEVQLKQLRDSFVPKYSRNASFLNTLLHY